MEYFGNIVCYNEGKLLVVGNVGLFKLFNFNK